MQSQLKILIVEDEMLIAANIANQLEAFGYEVIGIIPRGEEAIKVVQNDKPDLVLMDINLKGELDGIETAKKIQQEGQIPIIYLTANSDDEHFNRAKATNPYAFLSKPFKRLDLQRALELASVRILQENNESKAEQNGLKLEDRIFVKQNDLMCKILIADILYLEADRNYCQVFTKDKNLEEKLPTQSFQRVHRSYIVNLKEINEFNHNNITVGNKTLPLSKELRPELLARLQTI